MVEWLVVGLGNPGEEYALSPHNIGFMAIDRLAERCGARVSRRDSRALIGAASVEGRPALLVKPQTYMNLSGEAVRVLLAKNNLGPANLLVVYDDHDLPWSSLRIRPRGSAGGHHGMESVIRHVGTDDFPRVRLGIESGGGRADPDFLLKPMRREQRNELDAILDYAVQAVESIISEGVELAMTKYNRRAQGDISEDK